MAPGETIAQLTQQPAVLVAMEGKERTGISTVQLQLDTETSVTIPTHTYAALTEKLKEGKVRPVRTEIRKAAKVGAREVPGIVEQLINDGVLMMRGKRLALA